jgi:HPt (histidine-containing phosphotransfer) domain-containing protein
MRLAVRSDLLSTITYSEFMLNDTMQKPPSSDSSHLEQAIMDRIRQLGLETDPDFVLELIDSYAPLFKRLHDSLLDSHAKKDRSKIHYAAHTLKGACLNIGAADLAAVSRTIEEQSEQADFETFNPLLQLLDVELERTNRALLSIKSRLSQKKSSE